MKFKINNGTETFKNLKDVQSRMKECNAAASALAKELGGVDGQRLSGGHDCIAGGLGGIKLSSKPDGWRNASKHHYGFYFPKITKSNKPILAKIADLPKVTYRDLNSVVGFEFQSSGLTWFNCPSVKWGPEYVLLAIHEDCYFTPNADMVEILDSEYKTLAEALKDE